MTTRTQCIRSELELFSLPPLQTAIEEGQWVEYNPVSSINSGAPIEFVVTGSGNEYADLSKTLIEIKAEIRDQNGNKVVAAKHVAPVNNTLHSLFVIFFVLYYDYCKVHDFLKSITQVILVYNNFIGNTS